MLLSKNEISELHNVNQENCISIFIPTHRGGKKVLQDEDKLYLKVQLKNVRNKLLHKGIHNDTINRITAPMLQLIDDSAFWREQSDGLAVFIADGFFRKYSLPVHFKEFNYIANSFYLKPLLPMFVDDGKFHLILLEIGNVKLYECSKHSFTEIIIDHLIPGKKQDTVGYDYEEKNLQFRTQQAGSNHVMYHGQEAATGKRKNEVKKYLRAINNGLKPIINEENLPLLVASQDYIFDIYKSVNTCNRLYNQNVKSNLGYADIFEVQQLAWEKIAPFFERKRKDKVAKFLEVQGTGKTAIGIEKILNAAFSGKVDTLFCETKTDIIGNFIEDNGNIITHESEEVEDSISLMNLAAIKTFLKGGHVYLMDKEEIPNPNSRINALYRY